MRSRARRCQAPRARQPATGPSIARAVRAAPTGSPAPARPAGGALPRPGGAASARAAAAPLHALVLAREHLPHPPQVLQLASRADLALEHRGPRILPAGRHVDPVLEAALDRQVGRLDPALS